MPAFDPDAYLAGKGGADLSSPVQGKPDDFDPDAYLDKRTPGMLAKLRDQYFTGWKGPKTTGDAINFLMQGNLHPEAQDSNGVDPGLLAILPSIVSGVPALTSAAKMGAKAAGAGAAAHYLNKRLF